MQGKILQARTTMASGPTNKFHPPDESKNGQHFFDGKHIFCIPEVKKWVLDKFHATSAMANTATATITNNDNSRITRILFP